MKLLIFDVNKDDFEKKYPIIQDDFVIISDNGKIKNCIGCFSCWLKTSGVCILKDSYENIGELLSKSDEMLIISKCCYGTYSPFVKNVWDRSLSYLLPYFEKKNNETHHKPRYKNQFKLKVYFYGDDITEYEKSNATDLVNANRINFNITDSSVSFFSSFDELCKEVVI